MTVELYCENDEVCEWTGTEDDIDCADYCPECCEPTVRDRVHCGLDGREQAGAS